MNGLRTIHPKKWTTFANNRNKIYPYLLKELTIVCPNQVWQIDITYIITGVTHLLKISSRSMQ